MIILSNTLAWLIFGAVAISAVVLVLILLVSLASWRRKIKQDRMSQGRF